MGILQLHIYYNRSDTDTDSVPDVRVTRSEKQQSDVPVLDDPPCMEDYVMSFTSDQACVIAMYNYYREP